jgi:multidrug resistance efflux pump
MKKKKTKTNRPHTKAEAKLVKLAAELDAAEAEVDAAEADLLAAEAEMSKTEAKMAQLEASVANMLNQAIAVFEAGLDEMKAEVEQAQAELAQREAAGLPAHKIAKIRAKQERERVQALKQFRKDRKQIDKDIALYEADPVLPDTIRHLCKKARRAINQIEAFMVSAGEQTQPAAAS